MCLFSRALETGSPQSYYGNGGQACGCRMVSYSCLYGGNMAAPRWRLLSGALWDLLTERLLQILELAEARGPLGTVGAHLRFKFAASQMPLK